MPVIYLVLIWLHPGQSTALRDYERRAAAVMRRHGGAIERVLQPLGAGDDDAPDEVHLLAFDSAAGFAAFRADPALAELLALRDAAVSAARIYPLRDAPLAQYLAGA